MQENHEKQNSRTVPTTDYVVDSVIDKFIERAQFGREKYGVGLEPGALRDFERKLQEYISR